MSQDFSPPKDATQASARVLGRTHGTIQKFAIRRGAGTWERWDNRRGKWVSVPDRYLHEAEHVVREYAAGFYGVSRQFVRTES